MVKCGQKKLFPIILSNEGLVTCKWKAHLKYEEKKRKTSHMMLRTDKESSTEIIKPEFSINKTSGIITPNDKEIFDIFYQPNKPGHHEVELIFNLFQNNDRVTVLLQGEAQEPVLNISDPDICFDPVLPFPQDYEVCFTIENPCTFPIEFLFPDSDSQLSEEERILRVVSHFYKTEELLLPERSPGDKLPNELFDFYQTLIDEVSVKLLLQLYKDIDDHSKMANEVIEEKKPRKKITPRLHSTFSRHSTAVTADTGKAAPSLTIDPLQNKEPEEIEALLHEHIDEIHSSPECRNLRYDPIQAAMTASLASGFPVRESISKDGVLIVFHGAPLTEHVYAAHKTAKCLQLTPLNIDQMILEIAATGYTMPAMKVRDHLNTIYLDELNHMLAENEDPTQQMLHPQDKEDRMQDPLEELTNKVMFLDIYWHMRPGKTTDTTETLSSRPMKKLDVSHSLVRGGSGSQPSSQHSNRHPTSKKSPYIEDPLALHGTLANTPFDLLVELLRQSVGRCRPVFSLELHLRRTKSDNESGPIVFLNSFDQHIECLRRNKEQKVEKKKADYEAKLKKLETLSDDKLDDLNEEDFRLYTKINLEKRRQKFKLKKEEKQRALHEKYQKEMLRKSRIQKQQQQSKKHSKKGTTKSSEEGPRKPRVLGRTTSVMEANTTGLTSVDAGDKKRSRSALRLDERRKSRYKTSTKHDNDFIKKNSKIKLLGENFSPALSKEFSLHTEHPSELQLKFEAFQNDFEELIPLLENWDRKKGMIMNTILERVTPLISHTKKGTRRSKRLSDSHTHPRLTTPSIDMMSGVRDLLDVPPFNGQFTKCPAYET
ncbi:unnamed protein product [Timema podura]|uniref:Uncharacterized protein n=1 Tax=Timema podura TaxID=61482 RepID=A0ABN7NPF4_TIMPD|nr:unnamed protein product [Timema podura]